MISVGSGFESKTLDLEESTKLLIWGLTNFDVIEISKKETDIDELDVWLGKKKTVKVHTQRRYLRNY